MSLSCHKLHGRSECSLIHGPMHLRRCIEDERWQRAAKRPQQGTDAACPRERWVLCDRHAMNLLRCSASLFVDALYACRMGGVASAGACTQRCWPGGEWPGAGSRGRRSGSIGARGDALQSLHRPACEGVGGMWEAAAHRMSAKPLQRSAALCCFQVLHHGGLQIRRRLPGLHGRPRAAACSCMRAHRAPGQAALPGGAGRRGAHSRLCTT